MSPSCNSLSLPLFHSPPRSTRMQSCNTQPRNRQPLFEALERRQLMSAAAPAFVQTNLVSDGAVAATHTDPNLVNPWGIAVTRFGTTWVSDEGTGTSTVYDQAGTPGTPVVTIPV